MTITTMITIMTTTITTTASARRVILTGRMTTRR